MIWPSLKMSDCVGTWIGEASANTQKIPCTGVEAGGSILAQAEFCSAYFCRFCRNMRGADSSLRRQLSSISFGDTMVPNIE